MKKFYSAIKYILLLAVAVFFLWATFKGVKWTDFLAGVKSANFWWIGLSMLGGILAFFVRALRWRLIMIPLGKHVKVRECFDGVNIGYLTNFAIPRAGELARCGVVSRITGIPFETIAGTVVLERSIDIISLILVCNME